MVRRDVARDGMLGLASLAVTAAFAWLGASDGVQFAALAFMASLIWWWGHAPKLYLIVPIVGILASILIATIYLSWPKPYMLAYQFCYRHVSATLADGRPAVVRYEFGVKLLNGRKGDPVWFELTDSSLSLRGVASEGKIHDPPIKVTDQTRNALAVEAVDFKPPITTPSVVTGQYRFNFRYGRDPTGPFREKMEISGPITVSSSPGNSSILAIGQFPDSDSRRIERECSLNPR